MHKLLETLILKPGKLQKLDSTHPLAKKLLELAHASHDDQFWTIINSYLYHSTGHQHTKTPILPKTLFDDIQDLDDLYHQVAELYKAATDRVPPTRQDLNYVGTPLTIQHPNLDPNKTPPLVLIRNATVQNGSLTLGQDGELAITIYHP